MELLKKHHSYILLLASISIGGLTGIYRPDLAMYLKPFVQIYMNLLYISVVPTVFTGIIASITANENTVGLKKTLACSFLVFSILTAAAALLALVIFPSCWGFPFTAPEIWGHR